MRFYAKRNSGTTELNLNYEYVKNIFFLSFEM